MSRRERGLGRRLAPQGLDQLYERGEGALGRVALDLGQNSVNHQSP